MFVEPPQPYENVFHTNMMFFFLNLKSVIAKNIFGEMYTIPTANHHE